MIDKQTNLHPKNDSGTNLKPNIITENIPDKAVTLEKLDQNLQNTLNNYASSIDDIRLAIDQNSGDIGENRSDINKNTADIATNRSDIDKNTADIATNRSDIYQFRNWLYENDDAIEQNTGDIAKNRSDINKNTADIATNRSDIATNRSDIDKNTAEIGNLKASVNTGTFDPTSNDPAGQKSTANFLVDKDTYYKTAMIGRFAGSSIGPYQGTIPSLFPDWSSYTNMESLFAGATFYGDNRTLVIDLGDLNNTETLGVRLAFAFANTKFINRMSDSSAAVPEAQIIFGNGIIKSFYLAFYKCQADKILVKDGAICKLTSCVSSFLDASCNEIGAFDLSECTNLSTAFIGANKLALLHCKNIKVSLDISSSTHFTESALVEIIGNLVDLTGKTSQTLTMGATNLAKLTDAEKAIATNKNWTLA